MALTSAENIKKRLAEANDTSYYDNKWEEAKGMLSSKASGSFTGDYTFRHYPDIQTRLKEIGSSSKILNAVILMRAQVMRSIVEPEFPQLDKRSGEVRKQFWLTRAKGTGYADGDWLTHLAAAFLDAMPLGSGYVKFGARTNPETGYQCTDMMHVPILQFLFDRGEKTLARARYAADAVNLPRDIAEDRFGKKAIETFIMDSRDGGAESTYETVRVIEYWDTGYGVKGDPTRAVILGDITNDPIEIDDNYLKCLPYAHMDYLRVNNMRRATGLCSLMSANQEAINQQERKYRANAKRKGFDIVDQNELDPSDMERVNAGEDGVAVRYTGAQSLDKRPPFVRVPGGEVSQSDEFWYQLLIEDFRAISGISELEMGSAVQGAETLGEAQLVDQRSRKRAGLMLAQTALFLQRVIEKFVWVSEIIDNDPVTLDIFGTNIPLNVPGNDASSISLWLQEKSSVLIGEEALIKGDKGQEQQQRGATLAGYAPLVQSGLIDPVWWAEEIIKNGGDDPKEAMPQPAQSAQGQGMPQQPGMPQAPGQMPGMPPQQAA